MTLSAPHIPVLLDEVIYSLAITPGDEIVDGTFGAGGYSQAILAGGARVYAFDRDPDALSEGADLAGRACGDPGRPGDPVRALGRSGRIELRKNKL